MAAIPNDHLCQIGISSFIYRPRIVPPYFDIGRVFLTRRFFKFTLSIHRKNWPRSGHVFQKIECFNISK